MSNKKQPLKPTENFGYISFSKEGRVAKKMFRLSSAIKTQEQTVAGKFVTMLKNKSRILAKPSNDTIYDALSFENKEKIIIEITEISIATLTENIVIADKNYFNTRNKEKIKLVRSGFPYYFIINDNLDNALARAIENKLIKKYSKEHGSKFWLLVYSTLSYNWGEYFNGGKLKQSDGLIYARKYIAQQKNNPFDEIWYFNLNTNPTQVWPNSN